MTEKKQSISAIREMFAAASETELPALYLEYEEDSRAGVQNLIQKYQKQEEALKKERERTEQMKIYEHKYEDLGWICGIDEVGRGPLAGPVVAGAVILPRDSKILYLNDSKQLTAKKRDELYDVIMREAVAVGIGYASPARIDEINILQATYEAMREAISKLSVKPDVLLNDAVKIPQVDIRQVPIITEEAIAEVRAELGLDQPYLVRYFTWLWDCLHGDFGISYVNPTRTVAGELLRCLPATLQLAGVSFVMVIVLSLPIGFLCAVYKDGWFDKIMRGLVFMTTAMPAYWVGLLLMWLVSIKLDLLPTSGNGTWKHMILPSFTVSLSYISTYIRLIRNNMLENMKQDYVLYANVRGLSQKSILVKHILKNSMHTCIVAIGMSIPQLISGTIVVENVFAWPGLGTLCISSIFNRDYPVIQTYVLLIGVLFVGFNLLFDILQTISDPRMRKEGA